MKERGIGIEIDDFGTGHASIAGLMRVQPERLKIDRGLIDPVVHNHHHRRIIELIVEIGRTLDIAVTAEGIETEEHARIVEEIGVSHLQGFHFGRPQPPDQLIATLMSPHAGTVDRDIV